MENQALYETVYRRLTIEFQRNLERPLLEDEKNFIKWLSRKASQEYLEQSATKNV